MKEERLHILKMLEEGKISAQEADELLQTLGDDIGQKALSTGGRKFLRIKVVEDGKEKVNVKIPTSLVKVASHFIPQSKLNVKGEPLDLDAILHEVERGVEGNLIEVNDDDTTVQVYVE